MIDQSGMMETTLKKRILILAANPKATPKLRLDEEVREIKEWEKKFGPEELELLQYTLDLI